MEKKFSSVFQKKCSQRKKKRKKGENTKLPEICNGSTKIEKVRVKYSSAHIEAHTL